MNFFHQHKKNLIGITVSLSIFIAGAWGQLQSKPGHITEAGLRELYNTVLHYVENDYVEEIPSRELWFGAIKGILKATGDPHTRFMTPEEFDDLRNDTRGNFGGLGIEIALRDGILTVISPIEDTPAMRAGLEPGDKIVEIEKETTQGITLIEAVKKLRGKPGSSVNITVVREGEAESLSFDIIREIIKIKVVTGGMIEGTKIGYIKLKQFSEPSTRDIANMVKQLKENGAESLILDLRWNPGGLLDAAYKISNIFINEGVIVSTRGRRKAEDQIFQANPRNAIAADMKLVVLVNEGSASASEIVTGAVKDHKRGIVVGTKTFGKGSVQRVLQLPYNTGIALTIQKYYTPSGESIHHKGIMPDHEVKPLDFTKEDKQNFRVIREKKLVDKFIVDHKEYNKANIALFKKYLEDKKLPLSDFALQFTLKQATFSGPRPIYDLEFDVQLKKAIKLLN
ncbi:MAG: S41 family peptidase [Leptospirales bacterium]